MCHQIQIHVASSSIQASTSECNFPGYMPPNINFKTSPSSVKHLRLINHGQNLCFSNSVIQLLQRTEIKTFLLTELPTQSDPDLSTAQELARLFRMDKKVDSTAYLRR